MNSANEKATDFESKFNALSEEKKTWAESEKGYKAKISEYENNSAKRDIAKKYGLDESLVPRIQGTNKEEWEKDAEYLSSIVNNRKDQPEKGDNSNGNKDVYKNLLKGALKK